MIFRILAGLILLFHAALSVLFIFGMGFGVGLGEISKEYAQARTLQLLAYSALFAVTGIAVMFPYKLAYFVGIGLFALTILYFLWLMLIAQGNLLSQSILLAAEAACIGYLIWTYKVSFPNN